MTDAVLQPTGAQPTTEMPSKAWTEFYLPMYDSIAVAAGLPSLQSAAVPRDTRDVRIWSSGLGYDVELYRFVDAGGSVSGEAVLAWGAGTIRLSAEGDSGMTTHDMDVHRKDGRCREFFVDGSVGVCRPTFRAPPDWPSTLRRLEAVGLWTLPDESVLSWPGARRDPISGALVLGEVVVDGFGITVELRPDTHYRTYSYNNPSLKRHAEQAQAAELMRIINELRGLRFP